MESVCAQHLPLEIYTIIASFAETGTLKSLRLVSRAVGCLVTPLLMRRCFESVDVTFVNKASLRRLQRICECRTIAPHIKSIGFYLYESDRMVIRSIQDGSDLRETVFVRIRREEHRVIPLLKRCSEGYTTRKENGNLISALERSFRGLKKNKNFGAAVQFDTTKVAIRGVDDPNRCFDRHSVLYGVLRKSYLIQQRVMLALVRSGLTIQSLHMALSEGLTMTRWEAWIDTFADDENTPTDYRPQQVALVSTSLKQISLESPYIPLVMAGSLPHHILEHAFNVENLEIRGFNINFEGKFMDESADENKLIRCRSQDQLFDTIARRSLKRLELSHIVIKATDLAQLLRASVLTLKVLYVESVIVWGNLEALEIFSRSDFSDFAHMEIWFSEVKHFDGSALSDWTPIRLAT